jgi:hypothetical protein
MHRRFINAIRGSRSMYICFTFPFRKGIRRAPRINMITGGTHSIIIILFPLKPVMTKCFGNDDDQNASNKSIYGVESWYSNPPEGSMAMMKEKINQDAQYEADIEQVF